MIDIDDMPDVADDVVAEATAEILAELTDLLIESDNFSEWCRESVINNIPNRWDDLLDVSDLTEHVENEVLDAIRWAQKNKHL